MDLGLAGSTALITGAAGGIGAATAHTLAAEGANVVLIDRDREGLDKTAEQLHDDGARVAAVAADLSTGAGVAKAMRAALAAFDPAATILVNNAGTCQFRAFGDLTRGDWEQTLAVNLLSAVDACQRVLPVMRAAGYGVIINVASDLATQPLPGAADYAASKAALLVLTSSLAQAEAAAGIRVAAVTPGPIATGLWFRPGGLAEPMAAARGLPPRQAAEAEIRERGIPAARFGEPDEVAAAITWLASRRASYSTGAVLAVDGGSNRHIT